MIDTLYCIKCERLRNTLMSRLPEVRRLAQQKAIEENNTYIIYFDSEDSRLRYVPATEKEDNIIEYISKYS